jgi:hypothetical protein
LEVVWCPFFFRFFFFNFARLYWYENISLIVVHCVRKKQTKIVCVAFVILTFMIQFFFYAWEINLKLGKMKEFAHSALRHQNRFPTHPRLPRFYKSWLWIINNFIIEILEATYTNIIR